MNIGSLVRLGNPVTKKEWISRVEQGLRTYNFYSLVNTQHRNLESTLLLLLVIAQGRGVGLLRDRTSFLEVLEKKILEFKHHKTCTPRQFACFNNFEEVFGFATYCSAYNRRGLRCRVKISTKGSVCKSHQKLLDSCLDQLLAHTKLPRVLCELISAFLYRRVDLQDFLDRGIQKCNRNAL
jgi:hypothetical protein